MREDKIKGAMFGVACGDALGVTLEFTELTENHKIIDKIIGGGVFNLKPGETSDDTAMTLCVANGMIDNIDDPILDTGKYFIKWYKSNPPDIGITIRSVIENYLSVYDWQLSAKITHDELGGKSAGNGSLMRTLPTAFYKDKNKMIKITKDISKMTHFDNLADEACIIYNKIIYRLLNGEDKDKVILDEIKNTRYVNIINMNKSDLVPSGYVVDTLKCVLYCCLLKNNFKDILVEAVNLCGDADTIGAIAGGIAGAAYGVNDIPNEWINKLILKDEINNICNKLLKIKDLN